MLVWAKFEQHLADAVYPRLSEWACAGILMGLGVMLTKNQGLMAGSSGHAYDLMLMIASQETWAWIMKTFAGFRLCILLINGVLRRSPHLRAVTAFGSLFFWTQIALSFMPIFGYAFVFSTGILILDFVNIIRASRDARLTDLMHAKGGPAGGEH